jgi:ribonuclease D
VKTETPVSFSYIADDRALESAAEIMSREPVLAFDLESDNNLHHYGSKICLMQLATPDSNFIVDPLSGIDLEPLRRILESEDIEIVMHDTDFDMRSLDGEYGWRPKKLFDTLIAARLCGHESIGMASLVEHYFSVTLPKKFQRADWSARPLRGAMLDYAAGDVHYLLMLRERLIECLESLRRIAWAEEEFARCEGIRFEADDRPLFARVKGASNLKGRQLAVLDELALLRERIARRLNLPTFKVMPDGVLVHLAERPPKNALALKRMRGMHPHCRTQAAHRILDAIARGRRGRPLEWPRKKKSKGKRLQQSRELLDRLKAWRTETAGREGLDPSLVMPLIALKRLSAGLSPDEVLSEEPVRGWQRETFGQGLKAVLKNRKLFRR